MTWADTEGHLSTGLASSLPPISVLLPTGLGERDYLTPLKGNTVYIIDGTAFDMFSLGVPRSRQLGELVIHSDVSEKVRHGLSVVDSPNRFRKNQTDIHGLYLGTLQLLHLVRDSIRHHHLVMAAMEKKSLLMCTQRAGSEKFIPHLVPTDQVPTSKASFY